MQRVLLLFILSFTAFFSCQSVGEKRNQTQEWISEKGKVRVLCTTEMVAALVNSVGKEHVSTLVLIKGELDPHSYEPVKGDEEKLLYADLVFHNGLGLEHGPSLRQYLKENPKAVAISDAIQKQQQERLIRIEGTIDPHIWMDIALFSEGIKVVEQSLVNLDPEHKDSYQDNAKLAYRRCQEKHSNILKHMHSLPEHRRFLVTSHDAFNYFAKAYLATKDEQASYEWKKRVMAPEGLAPEGRLSLHDIKNVVEHLKKYDIRCIFPEANVNKDAIRKVQSASLEKGIDVIISQSELYGDSMGEEGKDLDCYLRMIEHNANKIVEELKQSIMEE
ncbi:MAG: zinc ABC transporter solute-binding protein [Chlamydiales bacterium]|nr:zinc ABC transporter substrate-binding protein [Chlamydiales bacterium]NCF70281.1 zinc ABC transporter solute-binding protein [Chlamydiales bacterium]